MSTNYTYGLNLEVKKKKNSKNHNFYIKKATINLVAFL
jgi:hypothetical protein